MTDGKDPREKTKETVVDFGHAPFEFKISEPFSTLKFFRDMTPDLAKEFEKRIRPQFETFSGNLVIDLSECGTIHPLWTRPLMGVASAVKKAGRRLRVVSSNRDHKAFFHDQGIASSFPLVPDLATAIQEMTAKRPAKLDVEFINPFLEGAVEILKKQAGTTATPGHLGMRDPATPLDGEVSGVITVASETFSGTLVISFPEPTYVKLVSRMLGETHEAVTPENRDAASELTNQIFGFAKRVLNEKGHSLPMALPTVVSGRSPPELPPPTGPRIAIPFESDCGPFTVEIRL